MKKILNAYAYSFLVTFCVVYGALLLAFSLISFEGSSVLLFFITASICAIIMFLDTIKPEQRYIAFTCAGAVIILLLIWGISNDPKLLSSYFSWLTAGSYSDSPFIYVLVTFLAASLLMTFILYKLLKLRPARYITAALITALILFLSIIQLTPAKLGIVCLVVYILMIAAELLNAHHFRSGLFKTQHVFFQLPVWLFLAVMLVVIPYSNKPFEWTIVKNVWNKLADSVEELYNSINLFLYPDLDEFSLTFAGYSDSGEIGGDLNTNDSDSLYIKSSYTFPDSIYMSGSRMTVYDGTKWSYEDSNQKYAGNGTSELNDRLYDVTELLYSIFRMDSYESYYSHMLSNRTYEIEYADLYTKTLFTPPYTERINLVINDGTFTNAGRSILFDSVRGRYTKYSAESIVLFQNNQYFADLLDKQAGYKYASAPAYQIEALERDFATFIKDSSWRSFAISKNIEAVLAERRNYIYETYMNVPENISERVRDLTAEITDSYPTTVLKLEALDAYLSSLSYTTVPGKLPEGRELIDYLLFDSQAGYCTYYATAFAVMARISGIPTRYVQGFCVPVADNASDGVAHSYNAHAWVEAYIDGIGWLTYEPTPSFGYDRRITLSGEAFTPEVKVSNPGNSYDELPKPEEPELEILPEIEEKEKTDTFQIVLFVILFLFIGTLLVFIILIARSMYKRSRYRRAYDEAHPDRQVLMDIDTLLHTLAFMNIAISPSETMHEYFENISSVSRTIEKNRAVVSIQPLEKYSDRLKATAVLYDKIHYGEQHVTAEEQILVMQLKNDIYRTISACLKTLDRFRLYLS